MFVKIQWISGRSQVKRGKNRVERVKYTVLDFTGFKILKSNGILVGGHWILEPSIGVFSYVYSVYFSSSNY